MTYAELRAIVLQHTQDIQAAFAAFDQPTPEPVPEVVVKVSAGGNLQGALDNGGIVSLEGSATWLGTFRLHRKDTILRGNGARLHGPSGPALFVPPGTQQVAASALVCTSDVPNASPVQIGAADSTQATRDAVPVGITLRKVFVPTHRGKRGFGLHGTQLLVEECGAEDIWLTGTDSQPWWIHNTPGVIKILGGRWSAGAELGLFGGAGAIVPGLVPTDVEVLGGYYFRPEAWETDGVDQEVKCGLEVKNGQQITFSDLTVDGCWQDAQPLGAAFMLTPAAGGLVRNIRLRNITLLRCADGVSVTGRDAAGLNPSQTTGIVLDGLRGRLRPGLAGGVSRGLLLLAQRGCGALEVQNCVIDTPGSKILEIVDATGALTVEASTLRLGKYGMTFGGVHASVTEPFVSNVGQLRVERNRFGGAGATARLLSRFPLNAALPEVEFLDAIRDLQ